MKCPKCSGEMKATGLVMDSFPAFYMHECSCGYYCGFNDDELDNERKRKEEQTEPANRDAASRYAPGSQNKAD